ncbi:MAG: hypothetical protein AAGA60_27340 [Cyanobacteria bacterium P01_E01_bin.42]
MREFRDFSQWMKFLLDDWDEEYYRAVFDIHGAIASLLRGQNGFCLYYTVERQDSTDNGEYRFCDKYNQSILIVEGKAGLHELDRYLTERFRIGENTNKNWEAWHERAHEACREDRFY